MRFNLAVVHALAIEARRSIFWRSLSVQRGRICGDRLVVGPDARWVGKRLIVSCQVVLGQGLLVVLNGEFGDALFICNIVIGRNALAVIDIGVASESLAVVDGLIRRQTLQVGRGGWAVVDALAV